MIRHNRRQPSELDAPAMARRRKMISQRRSLFPYTPQVALTLSPSHPRHLY